MYEHYTPSSNTGTLWNSDCQAQTCSNCCINCISSKIKYFCSNLRAVGMICNNITNIHNMFLIDDLNYKSHKDNNSNSRHPDNNHSESSRVLQVAASLAETCSV